MKSVVLPSEVASHQGSRKRNNRHIIPLCNHAYQYFDPREREVMMKEMLQYYSTSEIGRAHV